MPHIDEPLLQAYLDGFCGDARVAEIDAHLSSCDECAARLDAARTVAARASKLLGTLEPGPMHAPSFEELKERAAVAPADAARIMEALQEARAATAAAEPAKRDRSLLKSPVLAWAATIVIAFAVGWMTRGGLGTQPELAVRGPVAATAPQRPVSAGESVVRDSLSQTIQEAPDAQNRALGDRDQASADDVSKSAPGSRSAEDPGIAAEAAALPRGGFVAIRAADAELWLGAPPRTLPDLALVRVEVGPATLVDEALPHGNAVRIMVPLTASDAIVEEGLALFEAALSDAVAAEMAVAAAE